MNSHLTIETRADLKLPLADGSLIQVSIDNPTNTQIMGLRLIEQSAELLHLIEESLTELCVTPERADRLRAIADYVRAG